MDNKNQSEAKPPTVSNAFCILLLAIVSGCGSAVYLSHWAAGDVAMDGGTTGWSESPTSLGDKRTTVDVFNNEDYLYLRIVTTDIDLERQIVRQGLTFWFDREGGEQQRFGVHFPLGFNRFGNQQQPRGSTNTFSQNARKDSVEIPVNELEILGPLDGDEQRVNIAQGGGIDARFQTSHDTLTYELKVPISTSGYFPNTIGARPGTLIGISVQTSTRREGNREVASGLESGRRGGYGGRAGYGGRGGFGGGSVSGGRPGSAGQTKPFSQSFKVHLADHGLGPQ